MSEPSRACRQQLMRTAEGYLELMTLFQDRWPLQAATRDRLGQRALEVIGSLKAMGSGGGYVRYLEGETLRAMQRYHEAIPPLKESAEWDPDNLHTWLALGWCYKRIGRIDLAIQALEEALNVDPDEAIVHYNLACYWSLANNAKLAVKYLASALEIDPNYRERIAGEPDFDNIRHLPEFLAITSVIV